MSKHALVTGASGFLGKVIVSGLQRQGYIVTAISRRTHDKADISLSADITKPFRLPLQSYDLVVHAAGKAHVVPKTEEEKQAFYEVNRDGTQHLLSALQSIGPDAVGALVLISTVAVYGQEKGGDIAEDSPRSATDPYGLSKIAAEDHCTMWGNALRVPVSVLRLPLIAGHEAPGNLGAMVAGIRKRRYFNIAGGGARRSVVLARDVAEALPILAKFPGVYNLTDGQHPSFAALARVIETAKQYPKPKNLPGWMAGPLGVAGSSLEKITRKRMPFSWRTYQKMTHSLTFSDAHARETWGWNPHAVVEHPEFWL